VQVGFAAAYVIRMFRVSLANERKVTSVCSHRCELYRLLQVSTEQIVHYLSGKRL
jgi:hypothetical protein